MQGLPAIPKDTTLADQIRAEGYEELDRMKAKAVELDAAGKFRREEILQEAELVISRSNIEANMKQHKHRQRKQAKREQEVQEQAEMSAALVARKVEAAASVQRVEEKKQELVIAEIKEQEDAKAVVRAAEQKLKDSKAKNIESMWRSRERVAAKSGAAHLALQMATALERARFQVGEKQMRQEAMAVRCRATEPYSATVQKSLKSAARKHRAERKQRDQALLDAETHRLGEAEKQRQADWERLQQVRTTRRQTEVSKNDTEASTLSVQQQKKSLVLPEQIAPATPDIQARPMFVMSPPPGDHHGQIQAWQDQATDWLNSKHPMPKVEPDITGFRALAVTHWHHGTTPARSESNIALLEKSSSQRRHVSHGHEVGRQAFNTGVELEKDNLIEAARGSAGSWLVESQMLSSPSKPHTTGSAVEAMQDAASGLDDALGEYEAANNLVSQMIAQKVAPLQAAAAIASIQKAADKIKEVQGHMHKLVAPEVAAPPPELKRYSDSFYLYDPPDDDCSSNSEVFTDPDTQFAEELWASPGQSGADELRRTTSLGSTCIGDQRSGPGDQRSGPGRPQTAAVVRSQTSSSKTPSPHKSVKSPTQGYSPRWSSKFDSMSPAAATQLAQRRVRSVFNRRKSGDKVTPASFSAARARFVRVWLCPVGQLVPKERSTTQ